MEAIAAALLRPATHRGLTTTRTALKTQIRTKATAARAKRSANIPPHPSFLAPDSREHQDTIVFNPPSSSASVYHTPFKFLPKNDPRRRANLASLFESHFGTYTAGSIAKIPELRLSREKNMVGNPQRRDSAPVTKSIIEEIRALRQEDPYTWSVRKLSVKYDLPMNLIMAATQGSKEKNLFEKRKLALIQERYTPAKRKAMEDRKRRAEMLARGDL